MTTPEPGSFFLRHISGGEGRLIAAGQAFVRGGSYWTHAGVVGDGWILQGQPGGAAILPLSTLSDGRPVLFSDAPIQRWLRGGQWGVKGDALDQRVEGYIRAHVVAQARSLEHTGYSYLDYPVLALAEWAHAHPERKGAQQVVDLLRHRVEASGHRICSALVDLVYLKAGIHLYDDDRLPGDVTPQDLAEYDEAWKASS
jgi:hypothetical protein